MIFFFGDLKIQNLIVLYKKNIIIINMFFSNIIPNIKGYKIISKKKFYTTKKLKYIKCVSFWDSFSMDILLLDFMDINILVLVIISKT
jgi:hypothetical protein